MTVHQQSFLEPWMVKLRAEMDQKMEETREMAICVAEWLALARELAKSGIDPTIVRGRMQPDLNRKDIELERAHLHALIVAKAQRRAAKLSNGKSKQSLCHSPRTLKCGRFLCVQCTNLP